MLLIALILSLSIAQSAHQEKNIEVSRMWNSPYLPECQGTPAARGGNYCVYGADRVSCISQDITENCTLVEVALEMTENAFGGIVVAGNGSRMLQRMIDTRGTSGLNCPTWLPAVRDGQFCFVKVSINWFRGLRTPWTQPVARCFPCSFCRV
jgi:hypothetical protein